MDTQQVSVPPRAPSSGVVHVNIRLTDGYTIISNRLAQHRALSLLAIGLGTYIQSVPAGWRVGVKALAAIFPESEARIAAALRELERHGFLRRIRERARGGRMATRTESYNHPAAARRATTAGPVRRVEGAGATVTASATTATGTTVTPRATAPATAPTATPMATVTVSAPTACAPTAAASAPTACAPTAAVSATVTAPGAVVEPEAAPVREAAPVPEPARRLVPLPTAPKPPPPPLPRPSAPSAALSGEAARLLAGLRASAPQFVLSEADVERLAPAVAAWLERGMRPDAVRAALTDDPPVPLRHPAKLLRHRLIALLPPPLPAPAPVVPLQTCDDCDRAFRSAVPGWCGECAEVRFGGGRAERLGLSA
ncbi:hypothetical protein [Streptomyces sp. V2I9]|uniref:hypothetical protein n=1 Tax=Streptomyces sp. V2I9 TaxID=3042304 RepID=UPI00277E897A|nr:hypothetical protein [Streptomyces sp. V2I9]MDQ0986406.1 hypothetical protein [Streptomyces sp. V2I9]